ncbi:MAG TPA: triose-phosphate isomerase family protein [Candidatus Saccharimonadales bacterium]|nr:triose-phosphate isomerase family protein [Candidatus Saccharimonadales bacterium]
MPLPKFRKYVIANFKMNLNVEQVETWLHTFGKLAKNTTQMVEIIAAPSFPYLLHLRAFSADVANFAVAAQDVSTFNGGSYTSQVGAFQLKDFCQYCIIGHSETKPTKDLVLKKRDICLQTHLTPIVCFSKIKDAVDLYKDGVILAWEDPNTISVNGQYRAADASDIEQNIQAIKKLLPPQAIVVYGGSVNRQNMANLAKILQLDGVLVGNASLDPHHFFEIVKAFE